MQTMFDKKIARDAAKTLLEIKAITFNLVKPYVYTSGIISPMYTDNRLTMSHPLIWRRILRHYGRVIDARVGSNNFDVISGTATAAIPHGAVLAYKYHKPFVYVRSAKKEHGKENLIEGEFNKGNKVLIIEDLISTGKSTANNVTAIRQAGGKVFQCVAITSTTTNAFDQTIKQLNIDLYTITDVETTIEVAQEQGYISASELEKVKDFLNDPAGWGKRHGFSH